MQNFVSRIIDCLPSFFAAVILTLIGVAIGATIFASLWLLVFLWRKLITKTFPRVYEGTKPGLFALWFCGSIAVIPVAIVFQQSLQTSGIDLDFVPSFLQIWIYVIGGFLLAFQVVLIRDFLRRKKPESEISKQQG